MAKIACPNCGIPCTGCAGAKLATASDGTKCCTKCLAKVEMGIKQKQTGKLR
jgi:coenzyme F420-reducing hydrogenase gamma subunit